MESIRLLSFIDMYGFLSFAHRSNHGNYASAISVCDRLNASTTNRIIVKYTNTWPHLRISCGRNEIMHMCYSQMQQIIAASTLFGLVYSAVHCMHIGVPISMQLLCIYYTHSLIYSLTCLPTLSLSLTSRLHRRNVFSYV